ncbi:pyridine nucleotide-disulfide oxidoreductase, partial [Kouleothrix aurantiaca]
EFTFLLEDYLRQHGLREQTEIVYLSALSRVFPIENIANFADPLLHERGIRTELRFTPSAIDAPAKVIRSAEGAALPYDLLVLVPPHRGAQIVCEAGLGDTLGWVPTDRETLQCTLDPNIYAVGDAADLPISKSGSAAHFGAKVVANRIIAELLHRHELPRYTGEVMCFIETGQGQASQVVFDYNHPPQLPAPNQLYHYEKTLFNRFYWYLVPNGVV